MLVFYAFSGDFLMRSAIRFQHIFWVFILVLASFSISWAQIPGGQLPGSADPGRADQQLRPTPQQPIDIPSVAPAPEALAIPDAAKEVRFVFSELTLNNSTVYQDFDVYPLYRDLKFKEISLVEVYQLAEKLTQKYREDGYILSRVIVPPQKIADGKVVLEAVEGFVDQVKLDGDVCAVPDQESLAKKLAERIRAHQPLKADDLERHLLLLNDLPGITAKAVLAPSETTPKAADLTVVMTSHDYDGFAQIDNRGTRYLGPVQAQVEGRQNGFFGCYDQIRARVATSVPTDELQFVEVGHRSVLNEDGLAVDVSASYAKTEPGFTLEPFEVESDNYTANVGLFYPYLRGRKENIDLFAQFSYRNLATDSLGALFAKDRVRTLRGGVTYEAQDWLDGVTVLSFAMSQGLDVLGATDQSDSNKSRAAGQADFTKANLDASYRKWLDTDWSLTLAASGQYSANALLASEEFGLGGAGFGRAYDPSEITGDNGFAAKIEVGHHTPVTADDIFTGYELYGFADAGVVYDRDPAVGQQNKRSLSSVGVGARFDMHENVTAEVELGVPLHRDVATGGTGGDDPRVFFRLSKQF